MTTFVRLFFVSWAVWTALVSWYWALVPTEGMGLFSVVLIVVILMIARPRRAQ
jgi:hypothetical protein